MRHDLAIVRTIGYQPKPLSIKSQIPSKGSKAFAVGYPLDVGLTITEGVSNGKVEDSFYDRIHYTGALNSGMSGGPALNQNGEVIGVNVSGYVFSQLVNFLVPGNDAVELLEKVSNGSLDEKQPDVKALQKLAVQQFKAHSKSLLDRLNNFTTTQIVSGYKLPGKLSDFVNCSAFGNTQPKQPVEITQIRCSANAGLLIENGLPSGDLQYSYTVLSTKVLGAWRFAKQLSKRTTTNDYHGQRKYVGPYTCQNRIVGLKGFEASLMLCVRSHRKLDGLYDFVMRVVSLNGKNNGFVSNTSLYGAEFKSGMKFLKHFAETNGVVTLSQDIIIIECFDRNNRQIATERFAISDNQRAFTIGRSLSNDVCITDPYVAEQHTSVEITPDRRIIVTDLGSINGVLVNGKRHKDQNTIALSDNTFQIGQTHLKIRTSWEPLAPEKSNHWIATSISNNFVWFAVLAFIAFMLQTIYTTWLDTPRDLIGSSVSAVAASLGVAILWITLWALLSRIMIGQWRWLNHIAIGLGVTALMMLATDVYTLGWFAFDLPGYKDFDFAASVVATMILVYLHLRFASNASAKKVAVLAMLIPGIGFGATYWLQERSSAKNVNLLQSSIRVYPPSYRFANAEELENYFTNMSKLKEIADQKRDALPPEDI